MDDTFLIRQTLDGNRDAFRMLVLRHERSVFRFLGLLGFAGPAAEDIAQESFLRAYRHLREFDPRRAKFSTWLFTLARNLAASERARARFRREEAGSEHPERADSAPDPLASAEAREWQSRLVCAIGRLPETLRAAVVLARVEGLSVEEVAAIEGCAVGTVKSRIFRARELLRAALQEEG
jgi:RNA polymerase sigma-70 factor (ECF subfamily)